jgi:hypothetical protein
MNVLQLVHPDLLDDDNLITDVCDTSIITPEDISPFLQEETIEKLKEERVQSSEKIDFMDDLFEYIKDCYEINMLVNAYNAIPLSEMWDFVKEHIESFTWSCDYRVGVIMNKMVELGYTGHSGTSFGYIMRTMQYIAINGIDKFKNYCLMNNDKKTK